MDPVASTSSDAGQAATSRSRAKRTAGIGSDAKEKGTTTQAKRSRARPVVSCQECRRLKLKCDREFPCSACRKRGCADICPVGVAKPPGRAVRIAAEFAALLRRVDELESIVRDLGAEERIPPPLKLEEANKRSTTLTRELEATIDERLGLEDEAAEASMLQEEVEDEKSEDDAVQKVLVGVGSLSIAESGRTRFLGAAAGSAYYYEENGDGDSDSVVSATSMANPIDEITRYPYIQLGNQYPKAAELERLRGFLPDEEEARRLSDNYWKYLSFQFTPVEESVYWDDYWTSAWTPHDPHGSKLACVFIVLCLGTLFDPLSPATPNPDAHHYFILAHNTLAASRFLANSTLAGIQTLQLSANFLLNHHDFHQGGETLWPILGMAMRMLVTQGLHRDGSAFGLTGAELNRRRRVMWELVTLERMQSFISGRPHMLRDEHIDTRMPDDADGYQRAKWKIGIQIGKVIDTAFSVATPSYSTILALDQDMRDLVKATPAKFRSGALPPDAIVVKPTGIPQLPPPPNEPEKDLVFRMRAHTLDQMFSQVCFYLHKPAFAQALLKYSDEPLQSPWAASVAAVSLETAVYLLAVARSWNGLNAATCTRWWHVYFHAFAASVAQSSLVIKSPKAMLAPHAWGQINEAIAIFESAGSGGAPVAAFVPRLHSLRNRAFLSLQNAISVPLGLGAVVDVGDSLAEGTDAVLSILGPPTRLERKQRKKPSIRDSPSNGDASSPDGPSPNAALAQMLQATPALSAGAPPVPSPLAGHDVEEYHPLDAPILPRPAGPMQQNQASSAEAAAIAYLSSLQNAAPVHPLYQSAPLSQSFIPAASTSAQPILPPLHDLQSRASAFAVPSISSCDPLSSFNAPLVPSNARMTIPPTQPNSILSSSAPVSGYTSPVPPTAPNAVSPFLPQFTVANFATAFPLVGAGAPAAAAMAAGASTGGNALTSGTSTAPTAGDGWGWLDALGGMGEAPSPLDFSRYEG